MSLKLIAKFSTTLATGISTTSPTATLSSLLTRKGESLTSGEYGFILDRGQSNEETVTGTLSGSTLTFTKRGLSDLDGTTEIVANKFSHRKGATIELTGHPVFTDLAADITAIKDCTYLFPAILSYDAVKVFTDPKQIVDKNYVDNIAISGAPDASNITKGIIKLSSAPSSPTSPVALNNDEVSASSAANKVVKAEGDGKINQGWVDLSERFDFTGEFKTTRDFEFLVYENLAQGDKLKIYNDSGTYKIKKIVGINTASASSISKTGNLLKVTPVSSSKVIIQTDTPKLYVADYNGSVLSNLTEITAQTGTIVSFAVLDSTRIVVHSQAQPNNYARVADISSGVSYGGQITFARGGSDNNWIVGGSKCVALSSSLVVFFFGSWFNDAAPLCAMAATVSGNVLTQGSVTVIADQGSYWQSYMGDVLPASSTQLDYTYCNKYSYSSTNLKGQILRRMSISGTTITLGTENLLEGFGTYGADGTLARLVTDGTNKYVLFRSISNTTQMYYHSYTGSGTTLTLSSQNSIASIFNSDYPLNAEIKENLLYLQRSSDASIQLFSVEDSLKTLSYLRNSTPTDLSRFCSIPSQEAFCFFSNDAGIKVSKSLLDHEHFIDIADKAYLLGSNFRLSNTYNGLSSLSPGSTYYLAANGQSLTNVATYKKVGRAITTSKIIKE